MNWRPLARKEFTNLYFHGSFAFFPILCAILVYIRAENIPAVVANSLGSKTIMILLQPLTVRVGGLCGCFVSFSSVSKEIETRNILLLLGLPFTRRDLLIGKFFGRTTAVTAGMIAGFATAIIIGVVRFGGGAFTSLILQIVVSTLFVSAFVSIGLCFSMVLQSSLQAAIGTFGSYLGIFFFWSTVIQRVLTTANISEPLVETVLLRFNPINAYYVIANSTFGIGNSHYPLSNTVIYHSDAGLNSATILHDPSPWAHPIVSAFVLILWIIIPLCAGFSLFKKRDLD